MTDGPDYLLLRADALRLPLPGESVDLVIGSPPYLDCRTYLEDGKDLGIARDFEAWVAWMLAVTTEALRVSRGAVVWVAAGKTAGRNYLPACEALMTDWHRRGGHAYRPCYWHRVGIPGSGGDQWFRADIEHVMCFKRPGKLPWTDNTAMGHAPKWAPGGEMSHRDASGARRNQWGGTPQSTGQRRANGKRRGHMRPSHVIITRPRPGMHGQESTVYDPPVIANPGNLVHTNAGGGHTGPAVALSGNEAPYPEDLAEFFVLSLCPPGGTVLDCFSGSGTTVTVAARHGRKGVGVDLRMSQALLARRRVAAGLRPVSRFDPKPVKPLAGQLSFLPDAP